MSQQEQAPHTPNGNGSRRERMLAGLLAGPQVSPHGWNFQSDAKSSPSDPVRQTYMNRLSLMLQGFTNREDIREYISRVHEASFELSVAELDRKLEVGNDKLVERLKNRWEHKFNELRTQVEGFVDTQHPTVVVAYALRNPDRRRELLWRRSRREENSMGAYVSYCKAYDCLDGNPYDQSKWNPPLSNGKKKKGRRK